MKKLVVLFAVLGFTAAGGWADEQIRRIQEELRKRNFYFGEIDGKKTPETTRALRHYQQRKGFPATGEADHDTLAALNLAAATVEEPPWPEVPVLKSHTARQLSEEERDALEALPAIAEPPEPAQLNPEVATAPKPVPPEPPTPAILPERAEAFVRNYLDACETNQLAAECAYYAEEVNYFDHGVVDLEFIKRDVAAFYKRWPTRSYHLIDFKVAQLRGNEAVVKFRISFQYRSPKHRVAGKTDNTFTIQHTGDRMKFTSLHEQRLRD